MPILSTAQQTHGQVQEKNTCQKILPRVTFDVESMNLQKFLIAIKILSLTRFFAALPHFDNGYNVQVTISRAQNINFSDLMENFRAVLQKFLKTTILFLAFFYD